MHRRLHLAELKTRQICRINTMNVSTMSQNVGLRPSKAFSGNVRGLERSAKVQQRMIARPVTAMASAAMEEVPTPEKRVRPSRE